MKELLEKTLDNKKTLIKDNQIKVIKEYAQIPIIHIQKLKLGYVFSCLLDYIIDSMEATIREEKILTLSLSKVMTVIQGKEKESVMIQLKGTGAGLEKEELKKIFNQGYNQRKTRHHTDLHTCANYILEINGKIFATSQGFERGTDFTILINLE